MPRGLPRPKLAKYNNRSSVAGHTSADRPGLESRAKPTEDSDDCFANGPTLQDATGPGQLGVIGVQGADDWHTGRRPE